MNTKLTPHTAAGLLAEWKRLNSLMTGRPKPYIMLSDDIDILKRQLDWQKPEVGTEFDFGYVCGLCSNCSGISCGAFTGPKITEALEVGMGQLPPSSTKCARTLG